MHSQSDSDLYRCIHIRSARFPSLIYLQLPSIAQTRISHCCSESFCLSKQVNILAPETRLVIVGSEGPETAHLRNVAARLSITEDVLKSFTAERRKVGRSLSGL